MVKWLLPALGKIMHRPVPRTQAPSPTVVLVAGAGPAQDKRRAHRLRGAMIEVGTGSVIGTASIAPSKTGTAEAIFC